MRSITEALAAIDRCWPAFAAECLSVLGSELHYQAMLYHALRSVGGVPLGQIGMNVKQWIPDVRSDLFKQYDLKKHQDFRGGFEPIPDVVLFKPEIGSDWRRRRRQETLQHMLVAIEVKASERKSSRLTAGEISTDIKKLSAHRFEARVRECDFHPVMIVLDTAPDSSERMTAMALAEVVALAETEGVDFRYLSPTEELIAKTKKQ